MGRPSKFSEEALLDAALVVVDRDGKAATTAAVAAAGEALAAAAVAIPRYCREHPGEARSLTLFRHEEVLARLEAGGDELAACPGDLREAARGLNDEVVAVMVDLTRRRFGSLEPLELVRIAVQQTTYGLVRPFLGSGAGPIPSWLDDMVAAMVPAALAVADSPGWSKRRG